MPLTLRWRSASPGVVLTKAPSVTGRKPQEPQFQELETATEAFWSVEVGWETRHWKMDCELLPWAHCGGQSAAVAKA